MLMVDCCFALQVHISADLIAEVWVELLSSPYARLVKTLVVLINYD